MDAVRDKPLTCISATLCTQIWMKWVADRQYRSLQSAHGIKNSHILDSLQNCLMLGTKNGFNAKNIIMVRTVQLVLRRILSDIFLAEMKMSSEQQQIWMRNIVGMDMISGKNCTNIPG